MVENRVSSDQKDWLDLLLPRGGAEGRSEVKARVDQEDHNCEGISQIVQFRGPCFTSPVSRPLLIRHPPPQTISAELLNTVINWSGAVPDIVSFAPPLHTYRPPYQLCHVVGNSPSGQPASDAVHPVPPVLVGSFSFRALVARSKLMPKKESAGRCRGDSHELSLDDAVFA